MIGKPPAVLFEEARRRRRRRRVVVLAVLAGLVVGTVAVVGGGGTGPTSTHRVAKAPEPVRGGLTSIDTATRGIALRADVVSCASGVACVVVGTQQLGARVTAGARVFEHGHWRSLVSPPARAVGGALSCPTPAFCMLGGNVGRRGAVASALQGGRWTTSLAPVPAGLAFGSIDAIACGDTTSCVALGTGWDGANVVFADAWSHGVWRATAVPGPWGRPNGGPSTVGAAACVSARWCVAVGAYRTPSGSMDVIEQWDGRTWRAMLVRGTAPAGAPYAQSLDGVSCTSTTSCVATGWIGSSAATLAVGGATVLRWDGTTWTDATLRPQRALDRAAVRAVELGAVSCAVPTRCVALISEVGGGPLGESDGGRLKVLESDGRGWFVARTRVHGSWPSYASGVSCLRSGVCLVVGSSDRFRHTSGPPVFESVPFVLEATARTS